MRNAAIIGLGWWGQEIVRSVQGKSKRLRFTDSIEDGVDGMDQLERSVAFLKKKIAYYWP